MASYMNPADYDELCKGIPEQARFERDHREAFDGGDDNGPRYCCDNCQHVTLHNPGDKCERCAELAAYLRMNWPEVRPEQAEEARAYGGRS